MVTMKDVARLAGVSHSTVSNVINGAKGVNLEKVQRVEKAMKELNYEPNAIARNLKLNKTMQFDLIIPDTSSAALLQMYSYISRFAAEQNYASNLRLSHEDADLEKLLLNQAQRDNKDGVILMTCQPNNVAFFEKIQSSGLKIVFLERQIYKSNNCFVGIDSDELLEDCVSKLLRQGHTKIGTIVGPLEYSSEERFFNAYVHAHKAADLEVDEACYATASYDKEGVFREAIRLLRGPRRPTVFVCGSEIFAEAILKAINLMNIKKESIPPIIFFTHSSWANTNGDGFLGLQLPYEKLAYQAFNLLMGQVHGTENKCVSTKQTIFIQPDKSSYYRVQSKKQSLPSCKEKKKLRVLLTEDKAKYALETFVKRFEDENCIEVEIIAESYPKMYWAIKKEWRREDFDVFALDTPWMSELAQKKIIEPLDSYIQNDPTYYNDAPSDIFDKYCIREGKTYGLPFTFSTQLLFYRKDFFDNITMRHMFYKQYKRELSPPKTWNEFNEVARFFTRKYNPDSPSQYGTTLGAKISSGGTCEYLPRFWSFGGEIYSDGAFHLNSPQAIEALHNYKESFQYAPPNSTENWWLEQAQEFRDGYAAMMMTFADTITAVTERDKSSIIGKLGYELVPGTVSVDGGWALTVNAYSNNKAQAYEFIKWACSKELSVIRTILGGFMPCRSALENMEIESMYPWLKKMMVANKKVRMRQLPRKKNGNFMSEAIFEDVIGEAVFNAVTGLISPEDALNISNAKVTRLFYEDD